MRKCLRRGRTKVAAIAVIVLWFCFETRVIFGGEQHVASKDKRCNRNVCQLPECLCEGTDIPGQLPAHQVPQMVLLTFDDGVNEHNLPFYAKLGLYKANDTDTEPLTNPNGCPARATFFVSNDYTHMWMVKTLADAGNEVASHTLTHGNALLEKWDRNAWEQQVQGMREKLAEGIGRPVSEIRGMRAPYLELGGDVQFSMLKDHAFLYDSSMNGAGLRRQPIWPFSLDFPPTKGACDSRRCPGGSYPGLWEVPLMYHFTPDGRRCNMGDSCDLGGLTATKERVLEFLWFNFNRSYLHNRAPYMVCLHATWFTRTGGSLEALAEFLHVIGHRSDVWMVTMTQMLDWVRNPLPLSRLEDLASWQC